MEKRRVRLSINGVVCGVITGESEKYMQSLALEVGDMMKQIMAASPLITREAAALTVALSCCDDAHKFSERAGALKERMEELEVAAELWQEEKVELLKSAVDTQKDAQMAEKLARLESENSILEESLQRMKALEARAAGLEEENNALRQAAGDAAANEQAQLAAENDELRRRLQEANESARKREEALQATQQALTENQALRQKLDDLRESARQTERELEAARETAARQPQPEPDQAQAAKPRPKRNRRNPLRYQAEMEQEGLVSFFEKDR